MTDQEEGQAIIKARVNELDARLAGHDGFPGAYFEFMGGGRGVYAVYTANGIKPQGQKYGPLAPTAVDAAKGWCAVVAFLDNMSGTLFWRRRPDLRLEPPITFDQAQALGEEMSPGGWAVISRFVVADKEPVSSAESDWADDEVKEREVIDAARARYLAAKAAGMVKAT